LACGSATSKTSSHSFAWRIVRTSTSPPDSICNVRPSHGFNTLGSVEHTISCWRPSSRTGVLKQGSGVCLPENSVQLMRLVAMHNKLPHATWTYAMLVTIEDQKECLGAQRRSGTESNMNVRSWPRTRWRPLQSSLRDANDGCRFCAMYVPLPRCHRVSAFCCSPYRTHVRGNRDSTIHQLTLCCMKVHSRVDHERLSNCFYLEH